MKYKINPVYAKEMKLRVRSVKFAMTVFFFNLILIIIAITGFEIMFNVRWNAYVDYGGAARVYFIMICLEMLMVIFLLPSFTAGSIAGEREKQTLEILLTTTLKPGKIIMGKLMSSISMVILLVISGMPVLSIVFTVGGIGMGDLVQFLFAILVISFFIGSMGMFSSVILKKTVPATVLSFAEVLFVCGGTVIIVAVTYLLSNVYFYNVLGGSGKKTDVSAFSYVLLINPAFTILEMVTGQYDKMSAIKYVASNLGGSLPEFVADNWYGLSLLSQVICTWGFIKAAAFSLNPLKKLRLFEKH
ncbi:MAG: ABC transporter permease subunit [Lachnospiraceae bacterium]|nr:ABC transporter permease subunit [Lachnospiraceae bacterium]